MRQRWVFRLIACAAVFAAVTPCGSPVAQELKDWQAPTPWRLKKAAREAQSESESAKESGVVFKNASFWKGFDDRVTVRDIFNGHTNGITRQFPFYYSTFVSMYSARCRQFLPKKVVVFKVTETRTTRNGFGTVIGQRQDSNEVFVDERFAEKYEQHRASLDTQALALSASFEMAGVKEGAAAQVFFGVIKDVRRVFEVSACDSAFMFQFKENLLRLANGMPSLANVGIKVPNHLAESDPPD